MFFAAHHHQKLVDIFVNCYWVDSRWQYYSTHLHTNSTENNAINPLTPELNPSEQRCLLEFFLMGI
jgi:hypothetical protein